MRKQCEARSYYTMLNAETEGRHGLWLEIPVVILIMVEIAIAIVAGH